MILGHVEVQNNTQQTIYENIINKSIRYVLEPSQTSMMKFFCKNS